MLNSSFNGLFNVLLALGGLFTLYGVYYVILAVAGIKKRPNFKDAPASTRFAILIAARNEEAVIGQLVDSLNRQNYPKELYKVIVAPNNCTDNTSGVALAHGADVFEPTGVITSKGQVMNQLIAKLMKEKEFDAVCVFDADNLVHPNFLQRMNDAYESGTRLAQGLRDSKNPTDSAISACYSMCYWALNRFYNAGRDAVGLSALVNGCGFMVAMETFEKTHGWNTSTITEDYEFSAQCVILGERVRYVPAAVFYDEQPLTFSQSWKQRRRWSSGNVRGMELYFGPLVKHAVKNHDKVALDVAITFMLPAIQLLSLIVGTLTTGLAVYRLLLLNLLNVPQLVGLFAIMAILAFIACTIFAAIISRLNRNSKTVKEMTKGILGFGLFMLSWGPIGILSIFKKTKVWAPISHTKSMQVQDVASLHN